MTQPHQIRIRGPWGFRTPDGQTGTTKLPAVWEHESRRVVFVRNFNWLADLQDNERVWLVFAGYGGSGTLKVGGTNLGTLDGGPAEFEVTTLLQARNLMEVELEFGDDESRPGLWGDVRLEVRVGLVG